jgi:uncharacterized integral membrane protein
MVGFMLILFLFAEVSIGFFPARSWHGPLRHVLYWLSGFMVGFMVQVMVGFTRRAQCPYRGLHVEESTGIEGDDHNGGHSVVHD